jgi:lipopolysaccharide export system protein LptA
MNTRARLALASSFALALAAAILATPAMAQRSGSPILPGGNARAPISIDAGKLDFFDKEQKLVYSGGVVARQGEATLKASSLTIFFSKEGEGSGRGGARPALATAAGGDSQVRRMEAAGPVTIISRDQVGSGERGVYDRVENKVYLIGNPVLSEGPHVVRGDARSQLIYDLNTGRAQIVGGRVQSLITPGAAGGAADKVRQRP